MVGVAVWRCRRLAEGSVAIVSEELVESIFLTLGGCLSDGCAGEVPSVSVYLEWP